MIGYYVHHHGSGHRMRASAVAAHHREPVVALSSLPPPTSASPFAGWVRLPADPPLTDAADPSAGGALHWAPSNSPGYRQRMSVVADWVTRHRPRLVVVDVSVEVAVLVRTLGTPVVTVALPGERSDRAHTLAHSVASLVVAPWPREIYEPEFLRPVRSKVVYVGALSRFDRRTATPPGRTGVVQVLSGSGGGGAPASVVEALQRVPGWTCRGLGGPFGWTEDVWAQLCAADVVVTHAGLNAVAEVAAARRAAIVVPEARPFGEQHATSVALADAGLATVLDDWPEPARWPTLLAAARERGGASWSRWNDNGAGARLTQCLDQVAA